jgi:ABC-type multidrug transport system fused ATPase/permease subunit
MSTAVLDLLGVLLIGVVTALSVSVVSGSAPPSSVTALADRFGVDYSRPLELAVVLAVAAGVLLVSKSTVSMLLTRRVLRFLANRQAMVSGRLVAGLLSRPLVQVQRRSSQETAYALMNGVSAATLLILGQGVVAVTELALLLILAVGLMFVSPLVTLFSIAFFVVVAILLQQLLAGWAVRLGKKSSHAEVDSYQAIQEALRTYREVVVSNRRGFYIVRFQDLRWQAASVQSDLQFMGLVPKYVFEIALVVGAGLLAASQFYTKDADAALAVIAVFFAAGSRVVPSMMRLQGAAMSVRVGAGQAAPTFELADELELTEMDEEVTVVDLKEMRRLLVVGHPDFEPTISIRHVSVTYPGADTPAIVDASLELKSGSSLALVGPTGAGKSTLADLILGVLNPDMGEVNIGGISPLDAVSTWPGGLAYVPQEVAMASGTVRENVALGLPLSAIDDDLAWEALERAHLADFLRSTREGLDTVVGEHGVKLSGGQRQRLGVARALYTRPKLLVLDEATSALDAETEEAISQTLQDLEGQVTTVTVAHRLATIRHCDLVVYLESGVIMAAGTFDEVRAQSAHFDQQARLLGL